MWRCDCGWARTGKPLDVLGALAAKAGHAFPTQKCEVSGDARLDHAARKVPEFLAIVLTGEDRRFQRC
jgi:hypothetical protein